MLLSLNKRSALNSASPVQQNKTVVKDNIWPDDLLPISGAIVYLIYKGHMEYLIGGEEPIITFKNIQDVIRFNSRENIQEKIDDIYDYTHSALALNLVLRDTTNNVNKYLHEISNNANKKQILLDILGKAIEIAGRNEFSGRITPAKDVMANYQKIDDTNKKYLYQTLNDGMSLPDTMIFVGGLGYVGRVEEILNSNVVERKKVSIKIPFEQKHIEEAKFLFNVDLTDKNKRYASLKDPALSDWLSRFF